MKGSVENHRPCLERIEPYVPGKPAEEVCKEIGIRPEELVKLDANESPLGPSPLAVEAIRRFAGSVHLYPESSPSALVEAIASAHRVSVSGVVLGNGLDNVISMLCLAFIDPGQVCVMSEHTFLPYSSAAQVMGGRVVKVPMRDFAHDLGALLDAARKCSAKLLFLCNPNNPTGAWVGPKDMREFVGLLPPGCLLVVDEAYADFAEDGALADGASLAREGAPVIVLKTFSKAYGLAGLRIGFALAPPKAAAAMFKVREAFPVNVIACAAAKAALEDGEHVRECIRVVRAGRRQLSDSLAEAGVRHLPSQANFMMIQALPGADVLARRLLRRGVAVRSLTSWGLLDWIRVSVGTKRQNERFVESLEEALGME